MRRVEKKREEGKRGVRVEGAWKTQKKLFREPGSAILCCCCHGYLDVTRKKSATHRSSSPTRKIEPVT